MYLLVNVLEQSDHLTSILEGFADIGIRGTTILNSTGMGRVLMQSKGESPAREEIGKVLAKCDATNRTLFTVITNRELLQEAIEVIRSLCGDLSEPGKGIIFVLPLEFVEGLTEGYGPPQ
jgi:nitrogen regulatory protein PII